MGIPLKQLAQHLIESGLTTADELRSFFGSFPPDKRPGDAQTLVQELVRRRKLTAYQASLAMEGRGRELMLGRYLILDKIGTGGMGEVYQASHPRMKRTVAIKVLPSSLTSNEAALKRFEREVEAAARLVHPNIVTAFDADEAEGIHFLVMEYVDGIDVAALVARDGPLPVEQAVDYVLQAARGLEFAHSKGIIHRDIKPANLLLDSSGTIKVLDMGLARLESDLPPDAARELTLTQANQIAGTIDYMPPEQAADAHRADHRSDIYSLGCTLYRLLAGHPPFRGSSVLATIMAHSQEPIPPLRGVREDVPELLGATYQRMLAKRPEDRYQSMSEVIRDLEQCLPRRAGATEGLAATVVFKAAGSGADEDEDSKLGRFLNNLSQQSAATGSPARAAYDQRTVAAQSELDTDRPRSKHAPKWWQRKSFQISAGGMVLVPLLALLLFLRGAAPAVVVLDWPIEQRLHARLLVDGRPVSVGTEPTVEVPLAAGRHRVVVQRRGFEPITHELECVAGQRLELSLDFKPLDPSATMGDGYADQPTLQIIAHLPEWRKLREARRQKLQQSAAQRESALAALQAEVQAAPAERPPDEALLERIFALQRQWPDTPESAQAAGLLQRFADPANAFRAQDIPANDLRMAGGGDPASAPAELVAILGDMRLNHVYGARQIQAVAFHPQGKSIASSSNEGVRLWDAQTGEQLFHFTRHGGTDVRAIAFHPGGDMIASGGTDKRIYLWDPESGQLHQVLRATAEMNVYSLAFSPDGSLLASGNSDNLVRLWDPATGERKAELAGHANAIHCLDFSPDGALLASCAYEKKIILWNVPAATQHKVLEAPDQVRWLAFHPSQPELAACVREEVFVWNVQTGQARPPIKAEIGPLYCVAFRSDGQSLVASSTNWVKVWELPSMKVQVQWQPGITPLALQPSGRLVAGGRGRLIELRDIVTGAEKFPHRGHKHSVRRVAFSSDGRRLASAGDDGTVQIWEPPSTEPVQEIMAWQPVHSMALTPDNRILITGSRDRIRVWNLGTGQIVQNFAEPTQPTQSMAMSLDGKTLVAGGDDRVVRVWDFDGGTFTPRHALLGHTNLVFAVTVNQEGTLAASGGADAQIRVWDILAGKTRLILNNQQNVRCLKLSPDGRFLAAGDDKAMLRIWDLDQPENVQTRTGHEGPILALDFSPDGTQLVSCGTNNWQRPAEILLWSLPEIATRRRIVGSPGTILDVRFSPFAKHLALANIDSTVHVLRLEEQQGQ